IGEEAVKLITLGISIAYTNLAGADMVCHWPARSHTAEISGHIVDLSGPDSTVEPPETACNPDRQNPCTKWRICSFWRRG
ncbi:hypothetical protein GE21DRAFT_1216260, partial [Neurospora crassa]